MWRWLLVTALVSNWANAAPFDECKEFVKMGIPGKGGKPLCRKGYALAHDPVRKTPIWVAEYLTKARASGKISRSDDFRADPDLAVDERAEPKDYARSGYQQGHMAPAQDNAWDAEAMSESFLLSNMCPQIGPGMNGGIWKVLETNARDWAKARGAVYIFSGPIYPKGIPAKKIGKDKVQVPAYFYKIVYDPGAKEAIAFIMQNRKLKSSDMPKYIVAIQDVEQKTGLSFLTALSTAERSAIRVSKAPDLWP